MLCGKKRHELSCASCGAPLHELKMLRRDRTGSRELLQPEPYRNQPRAPGRGPKPKEPRRKGPAAKRGRRRKSMFRILVEEAADVIEDIFD